MDGLENANVTLAQSFNIDQNGGTGEELVVEISGDLTGDTSTHNVSSLLVNWTRWKDEHRKAAKDFDLEQIGGTGEELVVEVSGNLVANSDLHVMFKGGIYTNTVSVMGFLGFSGSDVEINNLSDSTAFNNADNHTIPTQLAVKSYVDERAYSAGRQNQDFNTADLTVYENFRFDGGHLVNAISNDNTLENSSATAIPTEYAVKSYADTKAEMNGAATEPFATKNLTVHGTFGFFNGHTITTISNSFDASNPSPTTISTEVAVKSYADTKAEMNGAATEPFATENLTVHGSFGFFNGHIIKEISNSFDAANPRQNSLSTEYAVKSFADANLAAREGNSQVDFNTRHLAVAGNFQLGGGAVVSNVTTNITTEENRDGSVPNASAVVAYINEVSTANRSNSTLNYSTNDLTVDGNLKFNDNDLVASKLSNNIETESQPTIAIPTVQAIREYSDTSKAPVNGDAGNDFAANHLQVAGNFTLGSSILNGVSASIDAETNATGTIPTVQAIKEYSDASKAPVNGDAGNDFAAKNLQVAGEFTLGSSILNGVSASIDAETNATGTIPTVQAIREYSDASKAPVNGHADNDFNTNHLHVTGNLTFGSNVLNGVSANIDAETNATGTIPNVQAVKDHVDGKADLKLSPSDGLVVAAGSSAAALSDITSGSSGLIIVRSIITGGVTELGVFAIHGNSAISKVSGDDTSYSLGISGTSLMVSNTASAGITAYITFLGA